MTTTPKRILILSILLIFFSAIGLISNLYSLVIGAMPAQDGIIPPELSVAMNIIGGIITIICAVGFLKKKNKLRLFYSIYMAITTIIGIASILTLTPPEELNEKVSEAAFKSFSIGFLVIIVLIPIIILFTKKSNKWFAISSVQEQNNETSLAEVKAE